MRQSWHNEIDDDHTSEDVVHDDAPCALPDGDVVGATHFDVTSSPLYRVVVPHAAQGYQMEWMPDANGNVVGQASVYLGDPSGSPLFVLKSGAIRSGSVPNGLGGGTYFTLVATAGSAGIVSVELSRRARAAARY